MTMAAVDKIGKRGADGRGWQMKYKSATQLQRWKELRASILHAEVVIHKAAKPDGGRLQVHITLATVEEDAVRLKRRTLSI